MLRNRHASATLARTYHSTRSVLARALHGFTFGVAPSLMLVAMGGLVMAGGLWAVESGFLKTPATASSVVVRTIAAPAPRPAAPPELQKDLQAIARSYGEKVGIAVTDVSNSWVASVAGQEAFPQQSVSKTWVAVTVLDAVDSGRLTLDMPVLMTKSDQSVFSQAPMGQRMPETGISTTFESLVRHALINSDNSANDTLIRLVGPDAVRDTLDEKGLAGITMGADERHLQAEIAGLSWDPLLTQGRQFQEARARLPQADRQAAAQRYLADPSDGATPEGVVDGLARLQRGELLSASSTAFMLSVLGQVRTGRSRLKGGLPKGWSIGHKTGTGQDLAGASIGINDVGVLTAPDGRRYAVAVMIPSTRQPIKKRTEMMQAVTGAVVKAWEAGQPFTPADAAAR